MTTIGATHETVMVRRRRGGTVAVQARIPDPIAQLDLHLPRRVAKECSRAADALRALATVQLGHDRHLVTGAHLGHDLADAVHRAAATGQRRPEFPTVDVDLERRTDAAVRAFARTALPDAVDIARLAAAVGAPDRGRYRSVPGLMGPPDQPQDASLVGPPAREVPRLVADVLAWSMRTDVDPVAQAALVEFQFNSIHPYGQANGRTARAFALASLMRRKLVGDVVPPFAVALASRRHESIALREAAQGGGPIEPWIEYFASAMRLAADAALPVAVELRSGAEPDGAWLIDLMTQAQRSRSRLLRAFGLD